jgi:hypothetical protein
MALTGGAEGRAAVLHVHGVCYCSRGESVRSRSVKSKRLGDQRDGRVADKEAFSVRAVNIISQLQ